MTIQERNDLINAKMKDFYDRWHSPKYFSKVFDDSMDALDRGVDPKDIIAESFVHDNIRGEFITYRNIINDNIIILNREDFDDFEGEMIKEFADRAKIASLFGKSFFVSLHDEYFGILGFNFTVNKDKQNFLKIHIHVVPVGDDVTISMSGTTVLDKNHLSFDIEECIIPEGLVLNCYAMRKSLRNEKINAEGDYRTQFCKLDFYKLIVVAIDHAVSYIDESGNTQPLFTLFKWEDET